MTVVAAMSTPAWVVFGICCASIWAALIKEVFIPLVRETRWARAHKPDPPESNLIEEYLNRAEQSRIRTYGRLGIRELPGKTRIGQDTRRDGLR